MTQQGGPLVTTTGALVLAYATTGVGVLAALAATSPLVENDWWEDRRNDERVDVADVVTVQDATPR